MQECASLANECSFHIPLEEGTKGLTDTVPTI